MSSRYLPLAVCAGLIVMTGCADPPKEEITRVQQAVEAAQQGDAGEYAPEALQAAVDAKKDLDTELQAQAERWSVSRSYDKARELARVAEEKAAAAVAEGRTARERAQQQASDDLAALRAACAETRALLDGAPRGKGTQADLAALRGDLDGVERGLSDLEASIAASRYREAITQAQAARSIVDTVRTDIQRATDLAGRKPARG